MKHWRASGSKLITAFVVSAIGSALPAACTLQTAGLTETSPGQGGSTSSGSSASGGGASPTGSTTASSSGGASSSMSASSSSTGSPPMCGNGVPETGEECDDSNTTPGDHCGPTCKVEHPDSCDGTPITLGAGQTLTIKDTTSGATDKITKDDANACGGGPWKAPDLVYAVTPSSNGTLKAVLEASYANAWLHLRSACPGATENELACKFSSGSTVDVAYAVTAGTTYFIAVDSWKGGMGSFGLTLSLQ